MRILLLLGLFALKRAYTGHGSEVPENASQHDEPHHRQKRVLWITNDGRIALPPGTIMTITPTLALPFVRYPPYGFLSNMTMSFPFTIDFDKLGLTDNENPYGALPPAFGRSMKSRELERIMAEYIAGFIKHRLQKRSVPDVPKHAFHGGERALLYGTAEDMLSTLGMDGKACLLRAICEVQGHSFSNFGLLGEMLKLFFTASKSPFAHLLTDYVEAENRGKSHGECWPYFQACPKSLFLPSASKYAENSVHAGTEAEFDDDFRKISKSFEKDMSKRTPVRSAKQTINPAM